MIKIRVNEQSRDVPDGLLLRDLRDEVKPDADLLIVNGFPGRDDTPLKSGDAVIFIRRGEIPKDEELEALMMARHTPGVHARMKNAIVGIAGLGGLGSCVAIALTRMGIGTLILADFDIVEPSNLNRQQYNFNHIGMAKTDAMTEILGKINPYIRVIKKRVVLDGNNIPEIFREAHVVVECFDRAEAKTMLVKTVMENMPGIYIIGASGLAGYGENNSIRTVRLGTHFFMVGDLEAAAEPGRGLMAPRVGIAACHQANLVVSLLMGTDPVKL
jgi:sulfur carrier protein ThiS adenylyltransferase